MKKSIKTILFMFASVFFVMLQTNKVNAATIDVCIGESKEQEVYYEYVSSGGDFVIDDKSVVSVEDPSIVKVEKQGTSWITWHGDTKVYGNKLSITGLAEGTTEVYLEKPFIGAVTIHIKIGTITVHQHQWDDNYTIDVSPTCTEDGQKSIHCINCSLIKESTEVSIPAKGHTEVPYDDILPTCTKSGSKGGTHCSECGRVITPSEKIKATGHSFTKYISDGNASCMRDGTKTAICDNGCGKKDTIIDKGSAKGHTVEIIKTRKEPTCAIPGWTEEKRCSTCFEILQHSDIIPPTEQHQWNGVVIIEPTATSEGIKRYTCDICKTFYEEKIPKLHVVKKQKQNIKYIANKRVSVKSVKKKKYIYNLRGRSTSGNKVKYKLVKGNKRIKLSTSSGKITVKKGTKKGTYKIKVKMMVEGDEQYLPYSKTKTITIKVR